MTGPLLRTTVLAAALLCLWPAAALSQQHAAPVCALLVDTNGSSVDVPENREWLLASLDNVVASHRSTAPQVPLSLVTYDETIHWLGMLGNDSTTGPARSMVIPAIQPQRWTNPLPALEGAAQAEGLRCLYHITDGTFDLSPEDRADEEAYRANVLRVASALGTGSVPITTITRYDDNAGLWRSVAEASGGLYLVNPVASDLQREVSSMLNRQQLAPTDAATPTADTSGNPSPSAQAVAAAGGGRPSSDLSWPWLGIPVLAALVFGLVCWQTMKPKGSPLTGILELDPTEVDSDSH